MIQRARGQASHTGTRRSERLQRLLDDLRVVESGLYNDWDDPELVLRGYSWEEIMAAAAIDRGLWTYLVRHAASLAPAAPVPARGPDISRAMRVPALAATLPAKPAGTRRGGVPV